jgi:HPt (histidine-containing phosphotransfer) domain-containing protein
VVFVQDGEGAQNAGDDAQETGVTWNFQIPGIDNEVAAKYFESEDRYREGLRTYIQAAESTAEKIREFRAVGNLSDYTIIVHGLKSSSKIIGAMEISELARRLEGFGHAGESEKAWQGTDELLEQYKACVDAIRAVVGNTAGEMQMLSKEELKKQLQRLGEAADAFDMETVLAWEQEMEQMEAPEGYQLLWKKLKKAVGELSFGEMTKIVELMLKREKQESTPSA